MGCDILWSDPLEGASGWHPNSQRGVSVAFVGDVVKEFLATNGLDLIVRAHQVVEDGYEFFAGRSLVTVFSAPNYGGDFNNKGAALEVSNDLLCSFRVLASGMRAHA